jgi:hypothetical protein
VPLVACLLSRNPYLVASLLLLIVVSIFFKHSFTGSCWSGPRSVMLRTMTSSWYLHTAPQNAIEHYMALHSTTLQDIAQYFLPTCLCILRFSSAAPTRRATAWAAYVTRWARGLVHTLWLSALPSALLPLRSEPRLLSCFDSTHALLVDPSLMSYFRCLGLRDKGFYGLWVVDFPLLEWDEVTLL